MPHIGYDLDGKSIAKPVKTKDEIDEFLDKCEDPEYWKTITDRSTLRFAWKYLFVWLKFIPKFGIQTICSVVLVLIRFLTLSSLLQLFITTLVYRVCLYHVGRVAR